jgi:protein phosphatase
MRSLEGADISEPRSELRAAVLCSQRQAAGARRRTRTAKHGHDGHRAAVAGTGFTIAHVGDSRAYVLRAGELTQITHDHTFVQTWSTRGASRQTRPSPTRSAR